MPTLTNMDKQEEFKFVILNHLGTNVGNVVYDVIRDLIGLDDQVNLTRIAFDNPIQKSPQPNPYD